MKREQIIGRYLRSTEVWFAELCWQAPDLHLNPTRGEQVNNALAGVLGNYGGATRAVEHV